MVKRRTFFSIILFIIFCSSCHTSTDDESDKSEPTTTTMKAPINLHDLGYDGDWNGFCDRKNIKEEFSYYPEHELKNLRVLLCHVREHKKYHKKARAVSAVYKYCLMMKDQVDQFIKEFVDKFSLDDDYKREDLISRGGYDTNTTCYNTTVKKHEEKCIASENPYTFMFRQIFARACTYRDLTTEYILTTIEKVCRDKFMTDKIDFTPYFMSVGFKA